MNELTRRFLAMVETGSRGEADSALFALQMVVEKLNGNPELAGLEPLPFFNEVRVGAFGREDEAAIVDRLRRIRRTEFKAAVYFILGKSSTAQLTSYFNEQLQRQVTCVEQETAALFNLMLALENRGRKVFRQPTRSFRNFTENYRDARRYIGGDGDTVVD